MLIQWLRLGEYIILLIQWQKLSEYIVLPIQWPKPWPLWNCQISYGLWTCKSHRFKVILNSWANVIFDKALLQILAILFWHFCSTDLLLYWLVLAFQFFLFLLWVDSKTNEIKSPFVTPYLFIFGEKITLEITTFVKSKCHKIKD